jgi:hypothetical protein
MAKDDVKVVFIVEMTEYERGWGQRPDGYYAFLTEQAADDHIKEETKDRTGPAPEVYVAYHKVGYRECDPKFIPVVKKTKTKRLYIDSLKDLK